MDNVVVSSSFFNFTANWFGSDTANFKLFDEDKKLAFQANDLKTDIDLKLRTGFFIQMVVIPMLIFQLINIFHI